MADINWGALLAKGAVSLLPALEGQRTARRQHDALERGLAEQAQHQAEADARVMSEIATLERSTPDAERARANEDFMRAVRRARTSSGVPAVPGASDRYASAAQAAGQSLQSYGQGFADLMSRIDAPLFQRRNEAESRARAGVDLDRIRRDAAADDWLMRFRIANRRPNPWAPLIAAIGGSLLEGVDDVTGKEPAMPEELLPFPRVPIPPVVVPPRQ